MMAGAPPLQGQMTDLLWDDGRPAVLDLEYSGLMIFPTETT
jgi:hypothetical protein